MRDTVAELDDELTRLVRRLRHPRVRELLTAGVDEPLERAPHVVLGRIARRAPVRLSTLAEELDVDVSTVSRQVATLEEGGLVARAPDPDDGRASRLAPTPAGHEVLDTLRDARREAWSRVFEDWTDATLAELVGLLGRFTDDLERTSSR